MDDYLDQFTEDQINGGYGDVLDELNAELSEQCHCEDEPWDDILAVQELEDFEQCDEYFGHYGDNDW